MLRICFANFKIITSDETKDEKGYETVRYGEVIRKVEPFLINSITKALNVKRAMKMFLRFLTWKLFISMLMMMVKNMNSRNISQLRLVLMQSDNQTLEK